MLYFTFGHIRIYRGWQPSLIGFALEYGVFLQINDIGKRGPRAPFFFEAEPDIKCASTPSLRHHHADVSEHAFNWPRPLIPL